MSSRPDYPKQLPIYYIHRHELFCLSIWIGIIITICDMTCWIYQWQYYIEDRQHMNKISHRESHELILSTILFNITKYRHISVYLPQQIFTSHDKHNYIFSKKRYGMKRIVLFETWFLGKQLCIWNSGFPKGLSLPIFILYPSGF